MAKLEEYRAKQREWVLQGGPEDFASYRQEVGAELMIGVVEQLCNEIEKEENQ